jgi:hypothetical protein
LEGTLQPNFDPCNVNAANYLAMLKEFFLPKWNDIPFHEESFFQQDTKQNAISWPARSPDLTPCDFFLSVVIKDNVYKKKARNLMQLQQNICEAFDKLKEREDHLSHVMLSLPERYQKCIYLAGGQIV